MNQTSSRRILLLAPHQDDECLQTAGIIYQAAHSGAHVSVCFATNGEYASEADAAVRTAESRSVLAALGVPAEQIYFLGYPDTGMPYEESFLRRLYDGCRVSASRWGEQKPGGLTDRIFTSCAAAVTVLIPPQACTDCP